MKPSLIIVATALAVAALPAMQVSTSSWTGGTEYRFSFSKDECAEMAHNCWHAGYIAGRVVDDLTAEWNGGKGKILGCAAATLKFGAELYARSRSQLHKYGEARRWTLIIRRRDNWEGAIRILDAIVNICDEPLRAF